MPTIPLDLDGYTDLPCGKIASVVTYLELRAFPEPRNDPASHFTFRRVLPVDVAWYRRMFRTVGEDWLWFSRVLMPELEIAALLADPAMEIFAVERNGDTVGFSELDRRTPGEVEIGFFGVVPDAVGTGAARRLMSETLARAFASGIGRVWLHTCTFDHPAAMPFYLGFGFRAWKFAIEVSDDPRLNGVLPETAAPQVALIK